MLRLSGKSAMCGFARRVLATLLFAAGSLAATAQSGVTVTGTVTDSKNEPVIGASVVEPGTNRGTTTNQAGKFTLGVSSLNATIQVSFVGMKPQTLALGGKREVTVTLDDESVELDRVVVTALGIRREEKALGYAISQIDAESLTAGREQNVMSAMMGKVAGVDISTTTAGPSGSTRVLIRGNSQLSGSNLPLYVVDGTPVDNSQIGAEVGKNGGYDYGDVLSSINPDDIESISVLKGPSASALYGSQASNGVIVITTKSGKKGKGLGIEINSSVSIVQLLTEFDDYQRVYGMGRAGAPPLTEADARSVAQTAWGGKLDPNLTTYIYNGETRTYGNRNNNILSFFDTGVTYNNSVSLTNATDRTTFRFAVSDMRNKDIVPKSTLDRTTFTMRGSSKFGKSITVDAQATYTIEGVENRPALSDNSSNIGNSIIGLAPNFDQSWLASNYKTSKGEYYNWNGNDYRFNPYWIINEMQNESSRNRLISQARFTWELAKGLKFGFKGALDTYTFRSTEYTPPYTPRFLDGAISERTMQVTQSNLEAMLTYTKKVYDFDITAFVGANLMRWRNETFLIEGVNQADLKGVADINNFQTKSVTHSLPRKEVRSIFGQASVGYKGFAYLDVTVRTDQSSTLPKDNNVYTYPSVSGSLIFSNLFEHGKWLTFGKLRASWAMVGGDTSPYLLETEYGLKNYTINGVPLGTVSTSLAPSDTFKPTKTYSTELGLDMKFLDNRFGFDLALYQQNTKDQIMQAPISLGSGYSRALINAGEIRNRGIEAALNVTPVRTKDVTWDATFTYSTNKNEVVSMHPEVPYISLAEARWANAFIYAMPGQPYGVIIGPKIARTEDGQMITDKGLPTFTEEMGIMGSGNYENIFGLSNTVSWKGISCTFVMDAKFGADLYSMSTMMAYYSGISTATLEGREAWYASEQQRLAQGVAASAWTPTGGYLAKGVKKGPVEDGVQTYVPNDVYVDPALYWGAYQSGSPEPFIRDASYIKLRELSLSWNLPSKWLRKTPLQGVTVSAYGRNLWLLYSNIDNIDPESTYNNGNGKGFEYGSLPSRRTFGFGLNVKF